MQSQTVKERQSYCFGLSWGKGGFGFEPPKILPKGMDTGKLGSCWNHDFRGKTHSNLK